MSTAPCGPAPMSLTSLPQFASSQVKRKWLRSVRPARRPLQLRAAHPVQTDNAAISSWPGLRFLGACRAGLATLVRAAGRRDPLHGAGSAPLLRLLRGGRAVGHLRGLPHRAALSAWLSRVVPVAVTAHVDRLLLLLAQDPTGTFAVDVNDGKIAVTRVVAF